MSFSSQLQGLVQNMLPASAGGIKIMFSLMRTLSRVRYNPGKYSNPQIVKKVRIERQK